MMKKVLKSSFIDTIPVLTGYIFIGFGFGIIMKANGFSMLLTLAMSCFIYAGSMQYVAVGLLTGGASVITAALTTLMVNARHLFYGISMIDKYKNTGKIKPYLIFSLTDETYSLVCGDNRKIADDDKNKYYFFVSLFNHIYWIIGTFLGAFAGTFLKFNTKGIDFALTALFITVFTEQWLESKKHIAQIAGVLISVICLVVFGKENFLIPSMIFIMIMLLIYKEDKKND